MAAYHRPSWDSDELEMEEGNPSPFSNDTLSLSANESSAHESAKNGIATRAYPAPTTPLSPTQVPHNWPASPRDIASPAYSTALDFFVDFLLLAFSLAFLALGLIVRSYDQAPTATNPHATDALSAATAYAPSIFPILFAAVLGRAAHAIFLWRLERGERVGVLDLLAGSTSLTSTLTSQLQMRMISLLGLALLALWSLSPIGGQASLRVMTIGTKTTPESSNFTYMVPTADVNGLNNSYRASYFGIINALFLSSLVAPFSARSSSTDTWGNVKIPLIESYENNSTADEQGWFTTSDSNDVYSSLVGMPISGMEGDFVNFGVNVEAQYLKIDCPLVQQAEATYTITGGSIESNDNTTARVSTDAAKLTPRSFTYTWEGPGSNMTISSCSMTTTYVEAVVRCQTTTPSTCGVSRLRRSQRSNPPEAYTLLDREFMSWDTFAYCFNNSLEGHLGFPTSVQNYLVNPVNPLAGTMFAGEWLPGEGADSPSNEVYAIRLGQLINSYWTSMNGMHAIPGGMTTMTAYMEGTNVSNTDGVLTNSSTVVGTRSTEISVIHCHQGWVVALSISSLLLVFASLCRPIIRYFTHAPDLMLNISSLATRDNPYLPLPASGTALDAAARSRLLRDTRVQLGDVEGASDIGKLAIGSVDPQGANGMTRVQKGRLYE